MTDTESTEPPLIPLWTDDALDSELEDRLDRIRFIDMVASRIDACVLGQQSTVFGLVGAWGSGKTSLIKFIRKRLTDDWKVIAFSPWASDNKTGVQLEFLAALASLLEGDDAKSRENKEKVRKYASVCAPLLGVIPGGGSAVAAAASKALSLTEIPWQKQFEEVSETLADLGTRVLLVADDIDRLDADELLALLKVVRLLGRFPNVHYLIAYDQSTVESLLNSKGLAYRSTAFMEKIVQYPFEVPPIAQVIQRRMLTETIERFLKAVGVSLDPLQAERFSELIGLLAPALITPRAQARFREQLLSFGGMLDFKEIDPVDFVALSFLRVFYHNIYDQLPIWKTALQSGQNLIGLFDTSEISDEDWLGRIRPLVNQDNDAVLVKDVLASLFNGIKSNLTYARQHDLALNDNTYFHRYFLFGVPEDDVPDQLILSALTNILAGNLDHDDVARYREILDGDDDQLAALAYDKGQRLRSGKLKDPSASLVLFLFERLKALANVIPSFASAGNVLWRWVPVETFESLAARQIDASAVTGAGLADELTLLLVGRMLSNSRYSVDLKRSVLQQFLEIYSERLTSDISGVLDSELDFNSVVYVVATLSANDNFHALGDTLLDDNDSQLLDRVVQAMVTVNHWGGGEDELVFNSDTLLRLFRNEVLIQLADLLPDAPKVSSIDINNSTPDNRRNFARANVKAIVEPLR